MSSGGGVGHYELNYGVILLDTVYELEFELNYLILFVSCFPTLARK